MKLLCLSCLDRLWLALLFFESRKYGKENVLISYQVKALEIKGLNGASTLKRPLGELFLVS